MLYAYIISTIQQPFPPASSTISEKSFLLLDYKLLLGKNHITITLTSPWTPQGKRHTGGSYVFFKEAKLKEL